MKRPWSGQVDPPEVDDIPEYDPTNPLCPGNTRSNGEKNPNYETTFVFPNDFAALLKETPQPEVDSCDLFRLEAVTGECKACLTHRLCVWEYLKATLKIRENAERLSAFIRKRTRPLHEWVLMSSYQLCLKFCYSYKSSQFQTKKVIDTWVDVSNQLSQYKWVQIFENRGKMMGCSNPHPHGQVWATSFLPNLPEKADKAQRNYFQVMTSQFWAIFSIYDVMGRKLGAECLKFILKKNANVVIE